MQGETIAPEKIKSVGRLIEPWFFFALVWSVGGTCDGDSRQKFDRFLRNKMQQEKVTVVLSVCVCVCAFVCVYVCVLCVCVHVCMCVL